MTKTFELENVKAVKAKGIKGEEPFHKQNQSKRSDPVKKLFYELLAKMKESVEKLDQSILMDFLVANGGKDEVGSKIKEAFSEGLFEIEEIWKAAIQDLKYPLPSEDDNELYGAVSFVNEFFMPIFDDELVLMAKLAPNLLFYICHYDSDTFSDMEDLINLAGSSSAEKKIEFKKNMRSWWETQPKGGGPEEEKFNFFGIN